MLKFLLALLCLLAATGCSLFEPAPGSLGFQDDFSEPGSGWDLGQKERGGVRIDGGKLRFAIPDASTTLVSSSGLSFDDAHISVEATKINGSDDNTFGLICRYQDNYNFYFFQISSDGYYGIGKMLDGETYLFGSGMMESHDAIQRGTAMNYLQAACVEDNLSFNVNGIHLGEAQDSDLKTGEAGLIAGTIESVEVEIVFDNFQVLEPEIFTGD